MLADVSTARLYVFPNEGAYKKMERIEAPLLERITVFVWNQTIFWNPKTEIIMERFLDSQMFITIEREIAF